MTKLFHWCLAVFCKYIVDKSWSREDQRSHAESCAFRIQLISKESCDKMTDETHWTNVAKNMKIWKDLEESYVKRQL